MSSSDVSEETGDAAVTSEDEKTGAMREVVLSMLGCHISIVCNFCGEKNFFGYRYKCAVCEDFDLCSNCFEDRVETEGHNKTHPLKVVRSPDVFERYYRLFEQGLELMQEALIGRRVIHEWSCKSCEGLYGHNEPITGLAFVCDDCRGYRLCFHCYQSGNTCEQHETDHCLLIEVLPQEFKVDVSSLTFIKKLGEGSFGAVYRGKKDKENVALKVCRTRRNSLKNLTPREQRMLLNEITIYQEFFCEYIVEFHGFAIGDERVVMVLELFSRGTLDDHLGKRESYEQVSRRRRLFYCENIVRGLFRMHKKGIIHKDLKPDNLFLTRHDTIKIGDMGIAFNPDDNDKELKYTRQALYYPKHSRNVSHPTYDMYAFGLLFNEIMTGTRNVRLTQSDCLDSGTVPYFGQLVSACLSPEARLRPTTECVRKYLGHFHRYMSEYITQHKLLYEQESSSAARNVIFDHVYQQFVGEHPFQPETDNSYIGQQDELMELLLRVLAGSGRGAAGELVVSHQIFPPLQQPGNTGSSSGVSSAGSTSGGCGSTDTQSSSSSFCSTSTQNQHTDDNAGDVRKWGTDVSTNRRIETRPSFGNINRCPIL